MVPGKVRKIAAPQIVEIRKTIGILLDRRLACLLTTIALRPWVRGVRVGQLYASPFPQGYCIARQTGRKSV